MPKSGERTQVGPASFFSPGHWSPLAPCPVGPGWGKGGPQGAVASEEVYSVTSHFPQTPSRSPLARQRGEAGERLSLALESSKSRTWQD